MGGGLNLPQLIEYFFYIYPNSYGDKYEIIHVKNNVFKLKRIDSNEGWNQLVKLKIIRTNNLIYYLDIGISNENEKFFIIE